MNSAGNQTRREFLATTAAAAGATLATGALQGNRPLLASDGLAEFPMGKAEHCLFIWLGGGSAQIDTWDPKRRGDAARRIAGSYYDPIDTAIDGVQVCEHLHRSAPLLDRATLVRTVNHDVIDEHAAAANRMHTGRNTSGTIVYPSLGSLVTSRKAPAADNVPGYVVMGYPNLTRGPGFLGAKHSYIYLTETKSGPPGLTRPPGVDAGRQQRREALWNKLKSGYLSRQVDQAAIANYAEVAENSYRLAGPEFMSVFQLDKEPDSLRNAYGSEFGQRCLLARRLVERGVRFIEVSHNLNFINGTGWDTHNEGQLKQHLMIEELDKAFSTLLLDLEQKKLLDKTLIVITGEFGRPAEFDAGGGRGHQSSTFSVVLAGGGLRNGRAVGTTDELSQHPVEQPVSVPDLFATIVSTLGIHPHEELYAGDRPVPITDMGQPIRQLFG